MIIFLDESGIHLKTGHSVFAVISVAENNLPIVEQGMRVLHQNIGPVPMHWSNLRWENRALSFQAMRLLPFSFQLGIFNNPLKSADLAVYETLGRLLADESISRINIDGKKSKAYASQLKVALRRSGITTRKIKTVNDEAEPGIQIADLIAGLYRHQLDKPSRESAALQDLIAHKQI